MTKQKENQEKEPKDMLTEEEVKDQVAEEQDSKSEQEEPAKEAEIKTPEEQLVLLQQQHAELKDKYLRLFAEFDNFKKRTIREKLEMMKTAAQDTMSALLPVLDDFDRTKKNAEDKNSKEPFSEGVQLVYQKLYATLKQRGLEPMETNEQAFDPELHEAITEIPAPSKKLKGKIVDTIEKGYLLKDKIIRHAKVVVGK